MRATAILLYTCFTAVVWVSPVQSNVLNGIVGQTVTFPAAVKEIGFIFKDGAELATASRGALQLTQAGYGTRLRWDLPSGLFSLSDLRRGDSGGYRVQQQDGRVDAYQLVVWDPVPRPQVFSRNKMKPNCSVLCSVENGREVTLSWHREGQTLSHTSSTNLTSPLSLSLEIEENSAPYSCVATNPVSSRTVIVRPEDQCYGHSDNLLLHIMFTLRVVEFVLVTLAVCLLIDQYRKGSIITLPSSERRRSRRRTSYEEVTEL